MVIVHPSSALVGLGAGDLDLVWDVPYDQYDAVTSQPGHKAEEYNSIGLFFLIFNFKGDSPVTTPLVRQPLTYAIDRVGMRDALMSGKGSLNSGPASDGVIGAFDAGGFPERHLERARSLISQPATWEHWIS